MNLVKEEQFNRYLTKRFDYFFKINQSGLYLLEITARCKNWSQNWKKLFDDDDLRIEINNNPFPKLKKRGLLNAPAAWNGNRLKNLSQTNFYLVKLDKLENTIRFIPDQKPYLEEFKIYQISDQEFSLELNKQAEDGNRRPWIILAIRDIPLKSIKSSASADIYKDSRDDDDLQIRIDGEREVNQQQKSHKYWYWCGRVLNGKTRILERETNFKEGLHYIELWADRKPILHRIDFEFGVEKEAERILQTYAHKGVKGDEDYNKFDRDIIKAVKFWNNEFSKQKYPPEELLDPNLVKAMIYIESRMGYYKPPKGYYSAYPDVMQVANPENPAIHTLNNDGWVDPKTGGVARESEIIDRKEWVLDYEGKANGHSPQESIKWGVRWLYHKAQGITKNGKRYWRSWKKTVTNYRSAGDKEYQNKVFNIYKNGIDPDGNKLWSKGHLKKALKKTLIASIFILLFIITGVSAINLFNTSKNSDNSDLDLLLIDTRVPESKLLVSIKEAVASGHINILKEIPIRNSSFLLGFIDNDFYSSALGMVILNDKHEIVELLRPPNFSYPSWDTTKEWQDQWELGEYTDQLVIDDINKDGKIEIAIEMIYSGTGLVHPFYIYQLDGNDSKLILYLKDGVSDVRLEDFNNDNIKEIYHSFVLDADGAAGRSLTPWKEIWIWQGGKYQKANNLYPEIYKDLIEYYNDLLMNFTDQAMIYYRPIIECLKKKAELNLEGVFADGRECIN